MLARHLAFDIGKAICGGELGPRAPLWHPPLAGCVPGLLLAARHAPPVSGPSRSLGLYCVAVLACLQLGRHRLLAPASHLASMALISALKVWARVLLGAGLGTVALVGRWRRGREFCSALSSVTFEADTLGGGLLCVAGLGTGVGASSASDVLLGLRCWTRHGCGREFYL
jgi:hypothetical protein